MVKFMVGRRGCKALEDTVLAVKVLTAFVLCLCAYGIFQHIACFSTNGACARRVWGRQLQSSNVITVDTSLTHGSYPSGWATNFNGSQPEVSCSNQTTAICLKLTSWNWWSIECQNCYQPLTLSNTSGIALDIAQLQDTGNGQYSVLPTYFLPAVAVTLHNASGGILCTMSLGSDSQVQPNFFFHASALFQNYPSGSFPQNCRAVLAEAAAIGFQVQGTNTSTSFSIDNIHLLPSNVVVSASASGTGVNGTLPLQNCYIYQGVNTTEAGNFTNLSRNISSWAQSSISNPGLGPADNYNVTIGIASPTANLVHKADLNLGPGSCSIIQFGQLPSINACAATPRSPVDAYSNACCFNTTAYQDGPSADQLPQMLADMCSQITIPIGSSIQRCHAILYKYDIGLAYFVTSDNGEIDLLGSPFMSGFASSACVRPATVFFEQIAAMPNYIPAFTNISNSVYSNGLGTGWSIASANNSVTLALQQAGAGLLGSTGLCINMTYTQGTAYQILLSGQDTGIANHPFANSMGLEVWMSGAVYVTGTVIGTGTFSPDGTWPSLQLQLLAVNGTPICSVSVSKSSSVMQNNQLQHGTAPFQGCSVTDLPHAASLSLIVPANLGAVCLDGLQLLSTTPLAAPAPATAAAPSPAPSAVPSATPSVTVTPAAAASVSASQAAHSSSDNGLDTGSIVGIVLTLAGFSAAFATWFAILLAYKASKRSIAHEIGTRVKVEDLSDADATVTVSRTMSDSAYKLTAIPESAAETAGHKERHAAGLQRASSITPLTSSMALKDSVESAAAASSSIQEVRQVAKQITQHCLRRWDSWLGATAGSDITGGKAGIWRGQFEGVRCAVLLLVFHRLNQRLQAQVDSPETLLRAWQECTLPHQRNQLVKQVADILSKVGKTEAQALPDKDPEVASGPTAVWSNLQTWLHPNTS